MRGLALIVMVQVHVFNSFARMDVRDGGVYALAVFVGGMAGPLFLFMAGMTFAFQMDRLERKEIRPSGRWLACLRRAGYILGIAYLIRIVNWATSWPHAGWAEITRVDILNSMGLAMAAFSVAAFAAGGFRIRGVLLVAVGIAAVSPLVANLNWAAVPPLMHEYLAPGFGRGHFPFFPCAAYVGFGMTAGAAVRQATASGPATLPPVLMPPLDFESGCSGGTHSGSLRELKTNRYCRLGRDVFLPLMRREKSSEEILVRAPGAPNNPISITT